MTRRQRRWRRVCIRPSPAESWITSPSSMPARTATTRPSQAATCGTAFATPQSGLAVFLSLRTLPAVCGAGFGSSPSRAPVNSGWLWTPLGSCAAGAVFWNIQPSPRCGLPLDFRDLALGKIVLAAGPWRSSNSIGATVPRRRHGSTSSAASPKTCPQCRGAKGARRTAFGRPRAIHGFRASPRPSASIRRQNLESGCGVWSKSARSGRTES